MSTCWYLHSYPLARFDEVFGSATKAQERKLMEVMAEEGFEEDDQMEAGEVLVREMLHEGISYAGKSDEEKGLIDSILMLAMQSAGLGKDLKVKPQSPDPVTLKVAAELVRHAGTVDGKLLPLFDGGRRYGTAEKRKWDCYFFLNHDEVVQLKAEVDRLLDRSDINWSHPDFPPYIRKNVSEPLQTVVQNSGDGLFARMT